ncbi:hypothetical protein [uncultured Paraglaciecola sp.]|uniref:hypothetical protein n=1 Tax=uncultured Paraglaciecola sp. TaxID=1765024 RepID=UPI0025FE13C1|nr:hypothetical protein [uncultured Paraglaciecola sp.]
MPLFTSVMKFERRTKLLSFFTHIPGNLATKKYCKMIRLRTEYHCIRCVVIRARVR